MGCGGSKNNNNQGTQQVSNPSLKKLPKKIISNTGQKVSKLGLGCMGFSIAYTSNGAVSEDESIELIGKALDQGLNFIDTAHIYGGNEQLVGKAIKKYGRERFFLASKAPFIIYGENYEMIPVAGTPENIKKYCDESLQRLGVDYIDLYYQHRVDATIPIETQAQAFKDLIDAGQIKYYGLSEASEDTIRRAHRIHPVTAVQEEYSLFSRDIELNGVLKTTQELGIALVAYSPLGRGILTGNLGKLDAQDYRATQPRFQGENLQKNIKLVEQMKEMAQSLNITPGQLALAWLMAKSENIFPIPGTKREKYLNENNQSANIKLKPETIKKLEEMFPPEAIQGKRYDDQFNQMTNISTPLLQVPKSILSNTNTEVSKIGLGCMGLSAFYTNNGMISEEESIELIGKALDQGVNFIDTAYIYGENEQLVGKAIKKFGRERFFLATKAPFVNIGADMQMTPIPGTAENIKKYCDESLQRLGVDYIDLYYQHRVDATIPIETQAQAFKDLIDAGKIKHYGLSEASEDTIRRAHEIHPITAVQEEFSLFSRDVEQNGVLKATQELGIALVAYSPLGRGILTGNLGKLDQQDFRTTQPRFQGKNFEKNQKLVEKLNNIAKTLQITSGQLALAWLLEKSNNIFPIPGTKREKYLTQNNQSSIVKLKPENMKQLEDLFPPGAIAGNRYDDQFNQMTNISTPKL